jgi:hypothetical protein
MNIEKIENLPLSKSIWSFCILLAITSGGMIGCATRDIEPLAGGYEEVTHTHGSLLAEPSSHRLSLQYKKPSGGRVVIWPSLYGASPIVKNGVAIFTGDVGHRMAPNNRLGTIPRLFAIRVSGVPLDITDEVLWRWSNKTGYDFKKLMDSEIAHPREKGNIIECCFVVTAHEVVFINLDWDQIQDIMKEVKDKGFVRKERIWGTTYIEKTF